MTDQERLALIDRYLTAYNSFEVDAMMVTVRHAVEFENVAGGEVIPSASGAEAFRLRQRSSSVWANGGAPAEASPR